MLARVLMSFHAPNYGIHARTGEIIEILSEKVFLDLQQANFVLQVDRTSKDD